MIILKVQVNGPVPKRGGSKPDYPEKNPDNQPENRYNIIIRGENFTAPTEDSNPRSLTLVISSLGQNAPAVELLAARPPSSSTSLPSPSPAPPVLVTL